MWAAVAMKLSMRLLDAVAVLVEKLWAADRLCMLLRGTTGRNLQAPGECPERAYRALHLQLAVSEKHGARACGVNGRTRPRSSGPDAG